MAEENNMDPELAKRVNAAAVPSSFVVRSSVLHAGDDAEDVSIWYQLVLVTEVFGTSLFWSLKCLVPACFGH